MERCFVVTEAVYMLQNTHLQLLYYLRPLHTTHETTKVFLLFWKLLPLDKTAEKVVVVVKKVVVCMEDSRIFRSFCCSVWGPLSKWLKGATKIFSSRKVWMMEKSWVSNVHGWSGSESWNILCAHCTLYIIWYDSGSTKSLLKLTSLLYCLDDFILVSFSNGFILSLPKKDVWSFTCTTIVLQAYRKK